MTRSVLLLAAFLLLSGCELLIRPMSRLLVKQCPGAIMWDGTANSPCRADLPRYSVETRWAPRPACAPDLFPAATYADHCARCHDTGKAPDLRYSAMVGEATAGELAGFIHSGRPERGMPSFADRLTECQIDAVAEYVKVVRQ
jgi:cytochrome c553